LGEKIRKGEREKGGILTKKEGKRRGKGKIEVKRVRYSNVAKKP
jgi:hypothetical protein